MTYFEAPDNEPTRAEVEALEKLSEVRVVIARTTKDIVDLLRYLGVPRKQSMVREYIEELVEDLCQGEIRSLSDITGERL